MKNNKRRQNTKRHQRRYSGIDIPLPWNYVLWYTLKAAKVAICAAFVVFMLWLAFSFIDVNLHNTSINAGEISKYNFFNYLVKAAEIIDKFFA